MRQDLLIDVANLSKKFCKSIPLSARYGLRDISKNFLGGEVEKNTLRPREFWALRNVGFQVRAGEGIALIGPNGSGKSTLLKVLQGIFEPDTGSVSVRGRVTALTALGYGFYADYTGRENIGIFSSALGLTNGHIRNKTDAIIEFAGLGDFIDSPTKHYSQGMIVRLGFSIAAHSQADVFLIDEALTAGDLSFFTQCKDKIDELSQSGACVLCVTHNLPLARSLFQKALWLDRGGLQAYGAAEEVCNLYEKGRETQFTHA